MSSMFKAHKYMVPAARAGRFIAQPTGYRAFVPAPLPPQPSVGLTGDLPGLLSAADRALGASTDPFSRFPNPDLFVFYVRPQRGRAVQSDRRDAKLAPGSSGG